jgi:hypothetical protein
MTAARVRSPLDTLDGFLAPAGLTVRGAFNPESADEVPPMPGGASVGTVILIGNVGGDLWHAFSRARNHVHAASHPLEACVVPPIEAAARTIGATAFFAHDGPPYVPIQRWARRAEPVFTSPIGLLIHPEFGLWHAYRAALCLPEVLALPSSPQTTSPCDTCTEKPCLHTCPVDAFDAGHFDVEACISHVEAASGDECRNHGCLARRACPIGRDYTYPDAAQAFHTAAFVNAARGTAPPR